jgi:hypothetical protein
MSDPAVEISQRERILAAILDRIKTKCTFFRDVRLGPARPAEMKPTCTVCDNGETENDWNDQDDESTSDVLKVRLMLSLYDQWGKESNMAEWTRNVAFLKRKLRRWIPEKMGVERPGCGKFTDDSFDCVYMSGSVEAVWAIDFEVTYFGAADAPGEVP